MISDVLSLTDHGSGDWGYGKVHAQMVAGPCGDVFVTSYWGTRSDLVFGPTYDGDILMRLDPESETIASLDTLHGEHPDARAGQHGVHQPRPCSRWHSIS